MEQNNTIQAKYKITKSSEIISNHNTIKYIKNWLLTYHDAKEFLKSNGLLKKSAKGRKKKLFNITEIEEEYSKRKGNLLITGQHGCGKSTIATIILKELNYDIISLNTLDQKVKIDIDLMKKLAFSTENDDGKPKVLLIDELESIITLNDKNGVFSIIKENNFRRWMPIVIITNNQHNKQLNEAKKFSNEVKVYPPYLDDIVRWVQNICTRENIIFSTTTKGLINKFVEYCQHDMRKILIQLDGLKINFGKNGQTIVTEQNLIEFSNVMKEKDLDFDLFKATNKILTTYKNVDTCLELYETEKVLVPLMVHENYYKFIKKSEYLKVLENLSLGDLLENYIHGEQNWDLLEIHGLLSCCIPSYYVNKYSNGVSVTKIDFAADLNRTSVKKMNRKNIIKSNNLTTNVLDKNTFKNVRNKSIEEYIYISEIMDEST